MSTSKTLFFHCLRLYKIQTLFLSHTIPAARLAPTDFAVVLISPVTWSSPHTLQLMVTVTHLKVI